MRDGITCQFPEPGFSQKRRKDKPPTRTKKQNFLTKDCTDYTDFLSSEPAIGPGQFLEPLNANSPGTVNRRNLG
jgi:hypothetical protein